MPTPEPPAHSDDMSSYYDLDPVLLASLRTSADEDAVVAAVETQLTAQACAGAVQSRDTAPVISLQRRAINEQRAA